MAGGPFRARSPAYACGDRHLPAAQALFKVLYSLPDADRASEVQHDLVRMYLLDGEVRNGGFNQYFHNTAEQRYEACRAFERAGAGQIAALVRRAVERFDSESGQLRSCWDGTRKGFARSYALKLFDEFDRTYYELMPRERFFELAARFIRHHAGEFLPER